MVSFGSTDTDVGDSNDGHNNLQEENNIKGYHKDILG